MCVLSKMHVLKTYSPNIEYGKYGLRAEARQR